MPFNPKSEVDLGRLTRAMDWSRRKQEPYRTRRYKIIQQYVGHNYSDNGAKASVPINLVEQFLNVYIRQLIPETPAAFVTASNPGLSPRRAKLELALNQLAGEIDMATSLRRIVFEALVSVGIGKVGLNVSERYEWGGILHDIGQPFLDPVPLDDWVHDMGATHWGRIDFAGHKYRAPLEWVKDSKEFKNTDELAKTDLPRLNEGTDERVDQIARSSDSTGDDEIRDYIDLWEIWIPIENLILTLPAEQEHGGTALNKILRVEEWQGPEQGPYHLLGFSDVPGSTMPLSPISTQLELHNLENALFRKASNQAKNQKTVGIVDKSAVTDADIIRDSNDMEIVGLDKPEGFRAERFNGADPSTVQMAQAVQGLFSQMAGNLDLLAGVAPQSDTATQDKLLASNASKRLAAMQQRVQVFTKGIFRDLGWWLWTDPLIEIPLTKRIPGTNQDITIHFTPEDREGDFFDYNLDVNPYSMQSRTPQEEMQTLMVIFQNFIIPFKGELQQQGVSIDFMKLLRRVSELTNFKSLDDFVRYLDTPVRATDSGPKPTQNQTTTLPGLEQQRKTSLQPNANRSFQDIGSLVNMISGNGGQSGLQGVA